MGNKFRKSTPIGRGHRPMQSVNPKNGFCSRFLRHADCYLILFIFGFLMVFPSEAIAQNGKTFMWKVEDKGPVVYILGSVHFLKKENYPLDPKIEKAFEAADTLIVEADISDMKKIDPQIIAGKALYGENDSLKNHVSRETYDFIKQEAARLGLPMEIVDRQKPWILSLTLASLEIMKLGYTPQFGIDRYFLSKVGRVKRVLELEGFAYQMNLLSSLSAEEQELLLLFTLKDLKSAGDQVDNLVNAWAAGDAPGLEAILQKKLQEDPRTHSFYEKFLYLRNREMAGKIEFYLKTNGTYFVVVGAAHLTGEKGIIQMLKAKGYKVQQR
jgi:uncharacterized protein